MVLNSDAKIYQSREVADNGRHDDSQRVQGTRYHLLEAQCGEELHLLPPAGNKLLRNSIQPIIKLLEGGGLSGLVECERCPEIN